MCGNTDTPLSYYYFQQVTVLLQGCERPQTFDLVGVVTSPHRDAALGRLIRSFSALENRCVRHHFAQRLRPCM